MGASISFHISTEALGGSIYVTPSFPGVTFSPDTVEITQNSNSSSASLAVASGAIPPGGLQGIPIYYELVVSYEGYQGVQKGQNPLV